MNSKQLEPVTERIVHHASRNRHVSERKIEVSWRVSTRTDGRRGKMAECWDKRVTSLRQMCSATDSQRSFFKRDIKTSSRRVFTKTQSGSSATEKASGSSSGEVRHAHHVFYENSVWTETQSGSFATKS